MALPLHLVKSVLVAKLISIATLLRRAKTAARANTQRLVPLIASSARRARWMTTAMQLRRVQCVEPAATPMHHRHSAMTVKLARPIPTRIRPRNVFRVQQAPIQQQRRHHAMRAPQERQTKTPAPRHHALPATLATLHPSRQPLARFVRAATMTMTATLPHHVILLITSATLEHMLQLDQIAVMTAPRVRQTWMATHQPRVKNALWVATQRQIKPRVRHVPLVSPTWMGGQIRNAQHVTRALMLQRKKRGALIAPLVRPMTTAMLGRLVHHAVQVSTVAIGRRAVWTA